MEHTELASNAAKARWSKVKSKKARSDIMKKVRAGIPKKKK